MIAEWIWLVWLPPASYFIYLFICRMLSGKLVKRFRWQRPKDKIIFQITTNGKNKHTVDNTIKSLKKTCSKYDFNYRIDVVTDEGCPTDYDANVVVVPSNYKTKKAKFKARALQYAVEYRKRRKENTKDVWIFHLDDESIVSDQCLKAIVNHINHNKEPIAQGLITYSNKFDETNLLTKLADCIRPPGCFECKFMTKYNALTHLHGSNLLVRADVEEKIGWDFDSIAEDSIFGIKALEKGYRVGWHYGVVIEQPVSSLRNLFKQRARWFRGGIQNIKEVKSKKIKLLLLMKLISWYCGFPSALITFIFPFLQFSIPFFARIYLLLGTILWILSYQIGISYNKGNKKERLFAILFLPIIGLIETAPAFLFFLSSKKFEVVEKK